MIDTRSKSIKFDVNVCRWDDMFIGGHGHITVFMRQHVTTKAIHGKSHKALYT